MKRPGRTLIYVMGMVDLRIGVLQTPTLFVRLTVHAAALGVHGYE